MSHKNKIPIKTLIKNKFDSQIGVGRSKHVDKKNGVSHKYIYSWETYRSYLKHACNFADWVKTQPVKEEIGHKPRTLEECRLYAAEWIQDCIEKGYSAYTIKLKAASLAKLYDCKITDFGVETPGRHRADISRSRGDKIRDKNFNEERHQDLVTFCRCTGLRRAELSQIRGSDLREIDGKYYLEITRATKGGKARTSPIVGSDDELQRVIDLLKSAGSGKVFPKVSTNADIHGYRAEYAARVYSAYKRDISDFKSERIITYQNRVVAVYNAKNGTRVDRETYREYYEPILKDRHGKPKMKPGYKDVPAAYYCREDLAGTLYDRLALFRASAALGHHRETVIAGHYLKGT